MIKKLDKLIVKAFIGPFIATFFIALFVLVMQFFWLWIDEFVGKGVPTSVILKFIMYQATVLVPLALPLAILLSSLMTFGNLGESFELVAIRSSGISLLRFMRPLFVVAFILAGIAFAFSNYVIPVATLKTKTLLTDIVRAEPAFDMKEGVFYDRIPRFRIKIGRKESDSIIHDVVIYEEGNQLQDNFTIAKKGVMRLGGDGRFLEFSLEDGWRYEERGNLYDTASADYIRIGFKRYMKQFDLSSLGFQGESADSLYQNNERMYSMRQLEKAIDSLERDNKKFQEQREKDMSAQFRFAGLLDTAWTAKDDAILPSKTITDIKQLIPDSARSAVDQSVRNIAGTVRATESLADILKEKERVLRKHKIEWHRKVVLSLACMVLFLIGAPLGSIIRRGGLGTPLIFALVFFMVFYFSSTAGEKFAKENTLTPFTGMWLATFVLLPIGIFLTYKAMHDSQLFNKEAYYRFLRKFRKKEKS